MKSMDPKIARALVHLATRYENEGNLETAYDLFTIAYKTLQKREKIRIKFQELKKNVAKTDRGTGIHTINKEAIIALKQLARRFARQTKYPFALEVVKIGLSARPDNNWFNRKFDEFSELVESGILK